MNLESQPPSADSKTVAAPIGWDRLLIWIGGLGPIGLMPASGTASVAIVGIPLVLLLKWTGMSDFAYLTITIGFTLIAVWVHSVGDRILGEKDSRRLVLDELVGYLIATAFMPATWPLVTISFFVERILDIAKIPPARQIENHVPGGWGVVGDDVIAGLYTLVIMQFFHSWFPQWAGLT